MIWYKFEVDFLIIFLISFGVWLHNLTHAEEASHKCSHRPMIAEEKLTHIWLNDANFSAAEDNFREETNQNDIRQPKQLVVNKPVDVSLGKTKRQTAGWKDAANFQSSILNSMWSGLLSQTPKKSRQLPSPTMNQDELVPMKIKVHYDASVHQLEERKFKLIVDIVMPSVIKFFEGVLLLKKGDMIERFRMDRICPNNTIYYATNPFGGSRGYCKDKCEDYAICGEMNVPISHLSACSYCNSTSRKCLTDHRTAGKGITNSQLLLYVSANQTRRCSKDQTIAYAAHCAQDPRTDRPIAGHANLCPASISTDIKDLWTLIATVKHELTHVLGFSVSLFAYYRDRFGTPLTDRPPTPGPIPVNPKTGYAQWSDRVIKRYNRKDWSTGAGKVDRVVYVMITPTVVREVRNHFNCSTLEGAELEDQGSDGTSLTHWEKRLFENEAMTGTHTQNSVYSRLTLAALQDTGWYVANFSGADKLDWGHNLGCDFAKQSCKSWIDDRRAQGLSIRPFCDGIKDNLVRISCTEDRRSKAVCNMKQYPEPLHKVHQNFDSIDGVPQEKLAYYGGSVDLADYCPFIQEFTWHSPDTTYRRSSCDLGLNNLESEKGAALEHYGSDSRCFEHGIKWEQKTCMYKRVWHHYGAGCYRYSCKNGYLIVTVGNNTYNCFYENQEITIKQVVDKWFYNGTLICPSCEKMCGASNCLDYDKQLIDKILTTHMQRPLLNTETDLEYMSRILMDELMNSIDSVEEMKKYKTSPKLRMTSNSSTETVMTNSLDGQLDDELAMIRKYLSLLPLNTQESQQETLVCYSGTSSYLQIPLLSQFLLSLSLFFILNHLI